MASMEGEGPSFKEKLRQSRRRTKAKILLKTKRYEATKDQTFEELESQFRQQEVALNGLYEALGEYTKAAEAMCTAADKIAVNFDYLFNADGDANRPDNGAVHAHRFHEAQRNVNDNYESLVSRDVHAPITKFLEIFPDIKGLIKDRRKLLLDYDAYKRKVQKLQANPKTDQEKLRRNIDNENTAKVNYETVNEKLINNLKAIQKKTAGFFLGPMKSLLQSQMTFHDKSTKPLQIVLNEFEGTSGNPGVGEGGMSESRRDQFLKEFTTENPSFNPFTTKAIRDYTAKNEETELTLKKDDVILVMGKNEETGMWTGENMSSGLVGLFPSDCVDNLKSMFDDDASTDSGEQPKKPEEYEKTTLSNFDDPDTEDEKPSTTNDNNGVVAKDRDPVRGSAPSAAAAVEQKAAEKDEDSDWDTDDSNDAVNPVAVAPDSPGDAEVIGTAKALYDYDAAADTELSFRQGDLISIDTQDASGWWHGQCGTAVGWFPRNFVETVDES